MVVWHSPIPGNGTVAPKSDLSRSNDEKPGLGSGFDFGGNFISCQHAQVPGIRDTKDRKFPQRLVQVDLTK